MYYTKSNLDETICAPATPTGTGAIAVIRISGKNAIEIVNSAFKGKNLLKAKSHTAHFGYIVDGNEIVDEVLATVFIEPKSYTGENTVEISCHGSMYIQQRILELLTNKGARLAQPGEFTLRAFLNKKMDLSQAEAVADLIASNSSNTHKTAMQQMRGGYSQELKKLRQKLLDFASLIELELDFSEEDVEFASRNELHTQVYAIKQFIEALIQSFKFGNVIKQGIPTVIAGKPNAGKSTLLNALLNEDRAIVSNIAGTTRDVIEETLIIDGYTFRLTDTAGIRKSADIIETIGIEKTWEKISKASIVLYLFDASITTPQNLKQELSEIELHDAEIIPIANKIDLCDAEKLKNFELFNEIVFLSSLEKINIDVLLKKLSLIAHKQKGGDELIVTNVRHVEALQKAQIALANVLSGIDAKISGELLAFDLRLAIDALSEILGNISNDELLGNIFSRFCIGK
ncbi:MAG: tRNA uridine-5-carboxymethylaminomethyl(34) synthesis GTPase MnmE [Bacteroidia bacterium]